MRRALLVIVALLSSSACGPELSAPEVFAGSDQSGSVRVALSATQADGSTYVLRDATLEISGSVLLTLSARTAHDDALTTPLLPSGRYGAFLRPGFHVAKLDSDGREHIVDARLVSPNPQRFALGPLEEATVKLTFALGSEELVFGAPPELRVTRAD